MRILIVTDAYPPEVRSAAQLMKDLAEELARRGHAVSVVTGGAPGIAMENSVRVVRARVMKHHNVNFILRGIAQLLLPWFFLYALSRHMDEPIDAVITHSPPLPLALVGRFIKRVYGAVNVLNVHDIFPQNAVDLGVLTNFILIKFFERMERKAYRGADMLMVPSESHKAFLAEKRSVPPEKIHVVPHWIDMQPFRDAKRTGKYRERYGLGDKLVFLFAGVLGPSQGLDMLIRAAGNLRDTDAHFLFAGGGMEKERLMALAEELKLTNVTFVPFVPSEEYPWLAKDCDVGIITLTSENTTPATPAKLMGYMAAGLPVAAFLHTESDGARIVEEAVCGVTAPSHDEKAVQNALRRILQERDKLRTYGENGLQYAEKHFTKEICAEKVEQLIK